MKKVSFQLSMEQNYKKWSDDSKMSLFWNKTDVFKGNTDYIKHAQDCSDIESQKSYFSVSRRLYVILVQNFIGTNTILI